MKTICEDTFAYTNRLNDFIEYVGKDEAGTDKWHIDTVLITRILLEDEGIKDENIFDCGICSYCNKDVVNSCRADGKNYGLGTAVNIKHEIFTLSILSKIFSCFIFVQIKSLVKNIELIFKN